MKIQILLCLFLILFSSNNRIDKTRSAIPEDGPSVISLIERYWQDGPHIYLKLTDYTLIAHFDQDSLPDLKKSIHEAYLNCRPMRFLIRQDKIVSAVFAGKQESETYLATLDHINVLDIKALKDSHDFIVPKPSYEHCRKVFARFLKDSFGSGKHISTLSWGCESRAGIIAKFLGQSLNLKNYKVFLEGNIVYRYGNENHKWSSHVINIVPFKQGDSAGFFVFDPFTLNEWVSLDTYLGQLQRNGSGYLEYNITEPDVFILYKQYSLGIIDRNYYFSGTIFRSLFL